MHSQQAFQGRPEGGPQGRPFGPHTGGHGRCGGGWPGGRFGGRWGRPGGLVGGHHPVPVNIEATDESFVLTLFAAGLDKARIQLAVQNDVLTIAYPAAPPPAAAEPAAAGPHYTRREFRDLPFERAFQLNGKVLTDQISARYADGILTVTLPKNPATNQPAQDISVS